MYTFSQTLQAALSAGNKQRVLLEFGSNKYFSNEEIAVNDGVTLQEFFCQETDLTIGQCLCSELEFTLLNERYDLDEFEFGTFTAWLGAKITSGTPGSSAKTKTFTEDGENCLYEFAPLGTFIAKKPDVIRQRKIVLTAYDKMTLFDVDMPTADALGLDYSREDGKTGVTIGMIFVAMCDFLHVNYESTDFINSDADVLDEPEAFGSATMRDVLGWIAEAACANARFNREGKLELVWFSNTAKAFVPSETIDLTPTWYTTAAINGLHLRNQDSSTEIILGANSNNYLIQDNPFLRKPDDTVTIVTQPSSISTTAGVHVSFLVQAKGEGLKYQWYVDGLEVENATSNVYDFVTEDAQEDYNIGIQCVVTDKYENSATSAMAALYVNILSDMTEEEAEEIAQDKWPDLYEDDSAGT